MTFESDKKKYMDNLYKPDKSNKGNVDLEIKELIDTINGLDNYYTTSSCAGRIILIDVSKEDRKKTAKWIFVTHKLADSNEVLDKLHSHNEKIKSHDVEDYREVWFAQEPLIMHVCCKDIASAQKFVDVALACSMKRSGIFSIKEDRVMVEIIGCDKMEVPLVCEGKILISDDYVKKLVLIANEKMKNIESNNNKFLEMIKEKLK